MKTNQKSSIKNHQWIKTGIFAAIFTLLTISVHAQTLPNTSNPPLSTDWTEFSGTVESVDSVTVGSRMPYMVTAQTGVPAGLTAQYKWLFSPAIVIQNLDGSALTNTTDNYYTTNQISVVFPSLGDVTISTNVRYWTGTTDLCAAAVDADNTIRVIPRPTITWTAGEVAGCVAMPVTIPVTVTGYKQFEVNYTITHYTEFDKSDTSPATTDAWVVLTGNSLIFPAATFPATGIYDIKITNITDRISRKSLDMDLVKAQATDLPTGVYSVKIYPAPQTNPLLHIKNM